MRRTAATFLLMGLGLMFLAWVCTWHVSRRDIWPLHPSLFMPAFLVIVAWICLGFFVVVVIFWLVEGDKKMTRYCLWGGGRDWVQIGSQTDRRTQALARVSAYMLRLRYAMSLTIVTTDRATQAFRELGAAVERSRLW